MRAADFATIRARLAELERDRRSTAQRRQHEEANAEADRQTADTLKTDMKARTVVRNGRIGLG